MTHLRIAAIAACAFFTTGLHANESQRYAYAWPLSLDGDGSAWQVELPIEVYAVLTDRELRDLVVVDAQGNPVPTALRAAESAPATSALSALPLFALPPSAQAADESPLNLRIERDADGRLRSLDADLGSTKANAATNDWLIDASRLAAGIDSLRLDWDDANGTAQFAISASNDLQNWRTVVGTASVLSLAQNGNRLDRHDIYLSGVHAKYLRLRRLDHGPMLPGLRVSAATSARADPVRAARQWIVATAQDAAAAPAGSDAKEYRYTLPGALPVEALKFDLADDNSVARVDVSGRRSEGATWYARAEFTAFRLHSEGTTIGNDEVALAGIARDTQWRARAATPLNLPPRLSLAWRPDRFIFLGEGKGQYRLAAGSVTARRADYPVDVALAQLRGKLGADWQPPLARLGARETLAGDAALQLPAPAAKHDWKTFLLWAVLVGAAALIGYLALSLLRAQKPPE